MIDQVLVPMGGSEMAEHTLEYALVNHLGAEITVLTVIGEPSIMMREAVSLIFEHDRAHELAAEHDVKIETVGRSARVIVNHATDYDAIVMGSHSGSVADRLFVGNVAETVFRRSPIPMTVV